MITDILIIGGGLAARRCAAIAAKEHSVTLLCDGGGASPYIHGINVPLHEQDSPALLIKDTLESGRYQNDTALVEALATGSLKIKESYLSEFDRTETGEYDLVKPLGATLPRVCFIRNRTGAELLRRENAEKRYRELSGTRALRLRREGDRITGAYCYARETKKHFFIGAKAVVLATGGFGGIFPFSTNSPDIGGDGIAMAYECGASLRDMEFIQFEPTVAVSPAPLIGKSIITTMLYEGAVIRNARGERFLREQVNKDALSIGIYEEIHKGNGTRNGGVYYDMTAVPADLLTGKYKDYYNRYLRVGIDIRSTPVEIAPAPHTTMGGVSIDAGCHTAVKGLFACGEVTGGLHGANRLGGNAGLEVLVFGDIAGEAVSAYAKSAPTPPEETAETADEAFDAASLRKRLQNVCSASLGVVRNESSLQSGIAATEDILRAVTGKQASLTAMRLYNDALTVRLALTAALLRRESVGSHVRSDARDDKNERYTVTLKKGEDGRMVGETV